MDWDNARIFLAVARNGQFLAAGRALKLDHATIARRVTTLEEAVGQPLFERRTNGVRLNAAGERFLAAAERIESEMMQAASELSASGIDMAGTVRIAAPEGFATWFLAPRLGMLMERHPSLSIQLVPLSRALSLSKREADLAITIERPEEGRLTVRKLTDYRLRFYAARRYLAGNQAPQTTAELKHHRLVTYVQDLQYADALTYFPEGFGPGFKRFECASVIAQMQAVRAGHGIGILHDYVSQHEPDLVPLLPGTSFMRSYWLIAHLDTRGLARIATVHDFIVSAVADAAQEFI
jgi:DNA-binding transcriptional LysR family regulator